MDDLKRGHELVYPDRAVRQALWPPAHLEEVSRGDAVFPPLIDEDDHLGLLQLLTPQATDERAANSIGYRHRTPTCTRAEAFDREHTLTVPDRPIRRDDVSEIMLVNRLDDPRQPRWGDHITVGLDLPADLEDEQAVADLVGGTLRRFDGDGGKRKGVGPIVFRFDLLRGDRSEHASIRQMLILGQEARRIELTAPERAIRLVGVGLEDVGDAA